jgi:hypothetical protein
MTVVRLDTPTGQTPNPTLVSSPCRGVLDSEKARNCGPSHNVGRACRLLGLYELTGLVYDDFAVGDLWRIRECGL